MKRSTGNKQSLNSPTLRSHTTRLTKINEKSFNKSGSKTRKKKAVKMMLVGSKKFKINTVLLREIRRLQLSSALLISKASFTRVVREILFEHSNEVRVGATALQALQEALEAYLVQYFEDSYTCTLHARRCTLLPRDMGLIQYLRKLF